MIAVEILLLLNLAATWWMVGLIWFVQIVHYPLMASVGEENFPAYESSHTWLTTFVVGPAMLVEVVTGIGIIFLPLNAVEAYWLWLGLGLICIIWFVTGLCSVPMHNRLEKSFDAQSHRTLVRTNWIRTLAWSARGLLMSWIAFQVLLSR